MIEYRTLSVRIEALYGERYKAIVCGPDGDGQAEFELPFGAGDLDAMAAAVSRPRSIHRRIESDESALARAFGERLFGLLFKDSARDVLRAASSHARHTGHGLRLMLQLDGAPRLRNVPWELLYDSTRFMSTSRYTTVLRYVDMAERPRPLDVQAPLRVLGMVSSPGDMPSLDAEREREQLARGCGALIEKGLLEIEWVPEATLGGLLRCLNDSDHHIFHFIGHGDFDEQAEDGVLLLEGRAGRSQRVTGVELGTILADQHTLRLAVVNACEGARVALDSSGIAGSLMRYGLPAVIAMQFEISDEAAISFAEHFYDSLTRGYTIDQALSDSRRGMFAKGHGLEWATPVLFTSIEDGRLFDVGWEVIDDPPRPIVDHPSAPVGGSTPPAGPDPALPRWWASRTTGAAAVAFAAVVALVLVVLLLSSGHSGSTGPVVGASVSVPQSPVGITISGGHAWVASRGEQAVSSIDLRNPSNVERTSVEGGPNSLAVDPEGRVWVAEEEAGQVQVLDPVLSHHHVLRTYEEVGRAPNTIAIGDGIAWVGNSEDGTLSPIRLDSVGEKSGGVLAQVERVGHTSGIAFGMGAVWVANSKGTVSRIDPIHPVAQEIPIGHKVGGITVGYGSVWVTNPTINQVSRIVPRGDGLKPEVLPIQIEGREPVGIASGPSGIWVANKRSGFVTRIVPDGSNLHVEDVEIHKDGLPDSEGSPNAVAVSLSGDAWFVLRREGVAIPVSP